MTASGPGAPSGADPRLARLQSLIGDLSVQQRESAREAAESDRARAEAAREGRLGSDWQAVQRRIDAGTTTLMDVFAGRDPSPEAARLVDQSRANLAALREQLPPEVQEEIEVADAELSSLERRAPGTPPSSRPGPPPGVTPPGDGHA